MSRGMITDEIKQVAKEKLNIDDFDTRQLRLIPYVVDCAINSRNINPNHLNQEERKVLTDWRLARLIGGGACDLVVSKKFWDGAMEILWLGYANK